MYASSGIRRYPEAAALLRKLMLERGIQADQSGRITNMSTAPANAAQPNSAADAPAVTRTIWDGVYSEEQAGRGQQVYTRACAVCHLDSLRGDSVSPALVGPTFFARFPDFTALEMVAAIRSSMPQNAPDSLGDQAYVDLVSYLLKMNGSRSGESDLKPDVAELEKIVVTPNHR